jgi:hypothetical protein
MSLTRSLTARRVQLILCAVTVALGLLAVSAGTAAADVTISTTGSWDGFTAQERDLYREVDEHDHDGVAG